MIATLGRGQHQGGGHAADAPRLRQRRRKLRQPELTSYVAAALRHSDPTARALVGLLLVRGGVHIVAYARALEKLTGADIGKLLPIPDISNKKFPESRIHEQKGLHRILYRMSPTDYVRAGEVWNGPHPEDGQELVFQDGPPEGAPMPDLAAEPQLTSPGAPESENGMFEDFARKLFGNEVVENVKGRS